MTWTGYSTAIWSLCCTRTWCCERPARRQGTVETICPSDIAEAARAIRRGELVAFPTETVYGLGANALDAVAVHRIFEAKGRPETSPLIVHVSSVEMARNLASEWLDQAESLAAAFWPGPLTLVVPKQLIIPAVVTAGLSTVGLRMPAHPIALELIAEAGVPIAAPSANRFTELSPTTAEHVRRSLGDSVAMVLDGGPSAVGIESTVVLIGSDRPRLLRPGMVSREELERVIGAIEFPSTRAEGSHQSPGQNLRHYRPRTPLFVVTNGRLPTGHGGYLWIGTPATAIWTVRMPPEPSAYAARLYSTLHQADSQELEWIAVEEPPDGDAWTAIRDRLRRAAEAWPG